MVPVELQKVEIGHMVAADHKERGVFQILLGVFHTAGGPEFDLFGNIGDICPVERPVAERFLDVVAHIPYGQNDVGKPEVGKMRYQMHDRGFVGYRDAGFWTLKC